MKYSYLILLLMLVSVFDTMSQVNISSFEAFHERDSTYLLWKSVNDSVSTQYLIETSQNYITFDTLDVITVSEESYDTTVTYVRSYARNLVGSYVRLTCVNEEFERQSFRRSVDVSSRLNVCLCNDTLSITSTDEREYFYRIHKLSGELITFDWCVGDRLINLPKGIYYIKVRGERDGRVISQLIVNR